MLVVSDSSPIIALINIGNIDVLAALFHRVIIPPAVDSELAHSKRPVAVREFSSQRPPWLQVCSLQTPLKIPRLHSGESEAISLALEIHADLFLVDDRRAYAAAKDLQLPAVGTIGILERGARHRLLDLENAFARLKKTDFWLHPKLLEARLARFRQDQQA